MSKPTKSDSLVFGELQSRLLEQITKNYTNFKKAGKERRTTSFAKTRLAQLEENMVTAKAYHESIIGGGKLESTMEKQDLINAYDQINETYLDFKSDLYELISSLAEAKEPPKPGNPSSDQSGTGPSSGSRHELRLPPIDLPKFDGSYTKWRSFHDRFISLVNENKNLSDIDKMHFLKSSLQGEADRLLQHFSCVVGNFEKAWELLKARYDNNRVLVNAQLKLFFNQPNLIKESSQGLKELIFTSQECIHALQNLEVPVEHWDTVLIYILYHKLPSSIQQAWEEKLGNDKELPKWSKFLDFLEARFRTLEVLGGDVWSPCSTKTDTRRSSTEVKRVFHSKPITKNAISCKLCNQGQHSLRKCQRFLNMEIQQRMKTARNLKVCNNCLAYNHFAASCPSEKCCQFCSKRHHSLLHLSIQTNVLPQNQIRTSAPQANFRTTPSNTSQVSVNPNAPEFQPLEGRSTTSSGNLNSFHASSSDSEKSKVLLATAVVKVKAADGRFYRLRALIDPGSEATFITESAAQLLKLKRRRTFAEVSGLGLVRSGTTQNSVDITFASQHSTFEGATRALIFKSLTGHLPAHRIHADNWKHLNGLCLADPTFYEPASVDLLFGSDVFAEILLPEVVRSDNGCGPVAQKTRLGWIVFGKVPTESPRQLRTFVQFTDVGAQLQKFWEVEEEPFKSQETTESLECDKHFKQFTKRLPNGRYMVKLPFKNGQYPEMGSSKECALRRFAHLEKKLAANPKLNEDYKKCIKEYENLHHMEEVDLLEDTVLKTPLHYFLPHHAVFKESSSTTKLRVVFDAAAKTSNGSSLNEKLQVGPKLQTNIIDLILRWRLHKITFTADIEKMYRQILVTPEDQYFQIILWRGEADEPIRGYKLKTVTFGTACAPYLAIKVLKRVAEDEAYKFPVGAKAVREDMYVDDLISGADTVEEALIKRDESRNLLASAGFNLRK